LRSPEKISPTLIGGPAYFCEEAKGGQAKGGQVQGLTRHARANADVTQLITPQIRQMKAFQSVAFTLRNKKRHRLPEQTMP
jgi:hypothetical protein